MQDKNPPSFSPSDNTPPATVSYFNIGRDTAQNSNLVANAIASGLNTAYGVFIRNEKDRNSQRILQWQEEINHLQSKKTELQGDHAQLQIKKRFEEDKIQDLNNELEKIRAEGETPDYLPVSIGTFIAILLTLFLYVFYSSTGYSAFFGIPRKLIAGFLAPDVFSLAKGLGSGVLAFVILFPIIFLAIGFILHISIERKRFFILGLILIFTFSFDVLLAYRIAKRVFEKEHFNDPTPAYFTMKDASTNNEFYIIIASGFVIYIIWGYLLNFILTEWKSLRPDKLQQAAILKVQNVILSTMTQLGEFSNQISRIEQELLQIENKINTLRSNIGFLTGGGVIISVASLKAMTAAFTEGWSAYATLFSQSSSVDIEKAHETSSKWLEQKIKGLQEINDGTTLVSN